MASPTPTQSKCDLGMAPNVAGLLCYFPCCVGLVFSIVAAIVEKRSRFVRFHAFQSLLLHGALLVISIGLQILNVVLAMMSGALGMIVSLLLSVVGLGMLGLVVFLMVKAYGNEEFELPVIGEMARKWAEPQVPSEPQA